MKFNIFIQTVLSNKYIKEFNTDLKLVYTAINEDAALEALSSLEEK
ncbi:hypothetical protein QTH28_09550 [Clostridium perfringens]|nr:hypothetical protein [Clostridium perfringens]MDM0472513.1 hypothetical protein [Clostridium perfringens]